MRLVVAVCLTVLLLPGVGSAQGKAEIERLKKEIELLKREIDLIKRENELHKRENDLLRKGNTGKPADAQADSATSVTVDNVEYVYQGMARNAATVLVTVLATSKRGDRQGPNGQMTLVDEDGEKYQGMPAGGFGLRPALREGVPVKLTWRFGPNPITGKSSAPSPRITRFPLLTIASDVGGVGDAIEFRDVPTAVSKAKAK